MIGHDENRDLCRNLDTSILAANPANFIRGTRPDQIGVIGKLLGALSRDAGGAHAYDENAPVMTVFDFAYIEQSFLLECIDGHCYRPIPKAKRLFQATDLVAMNVPAPSHATTAASSTPFLSRRIIISEAPKGMAKRSVQTSRHDV